MQIAVVSDTHGRVESTRAAVDVLSGLEIELVIHCGDIGSPAIVPLFDRWPAHFVFGNVDFEEDLLRQTIEAAGKSCHGRFGELELAGRRIAFLHGDDDRRLGETIAGGGYDLVCHGHTHRAEQRREGGTLVLNPGALHRAKPHSLALVELPSLEVTNVEL